MGKDSLAPPSGFLGSIKDLCCAMGFCAVPALFATLWTVARRAPLSIGFSRQEYWSGLPFPSPGDLPDPGTEPTSLLSPSLAGGFFFFFLNHQHQRICQKFFSEFGADFGEGPNLKQLPEKSGWMKKVKAEVYPENMKYLDFGSL